ncbi:MAG TPA: DUF2845 domain-containing protein [Pseudomonas sp.]|nr:DUF2845 domain-containing protein [Pseudomonas sp.]
MNRLTIVLALALASGLVQAETLRCGSKLVSLGDRAFEVQQKCGEPAFRDEVGYSLGEYDRRELRVEEWAYGPENGMLRILTFVGNRLTRIESRRSH